MPKGLYSQCVCLLTDGSSSIDAVRTAVEKAGFEVVKELDGAESWEISGPSLIVPYRREVNGGVSIDVIQHRWPDDMGDPKTGMMLFAAWSMGHFGPFAFPGGFARAMEHAWSWQAARQIASVHQGVIQIRVSYVGGLPETAGTLPEDCDAIAELWFLNRLVMAIGKVPGILCYFNPNGEVLRHLDSFRTICDQSGREKKLPLLLWTNVRLFKLDQVFGFMDTVGNEQLNVRDVEVIYPIGKYDPRDIDYYMRNVTHYLLGMKRELRTGERIDGPGERKLSWVIESLDESFMTPPRRVLRLYAATASNQIGAALAKASHSRVVKRKRTWWKFW